MGFYYGKCRFSALSWFVYCAVVSKGTLSLTYNAGIHVKHCFMYNCT